MAGNFGPTVVTFECMENCNYIAVDNLKSLLCFINKRENIATACSRTSVCIKIACSSSFNNMRLLTIATNRTIKEHTRGYKLILVFVSVVFVFVLFSEFLMLVNFYTRKVMHYALLSL